MPYLIGLVLTKLVSFAAWIAAFTAVVFAALWLLGTDLGAWVFEQALDITISVLNSTDFNLEIFNPQTYLSALPPQVLNMLGMLRLGECFAIISAACVIKVLLQLVPFTRLGS